MNLMKNKFDLKINYELYNFINTDVLPGTEITEDVFWKGFSNLVEKFSFRNLELLKKRQFLQDKINLWHNKSVGEGQNYENYKNFLYDIGYLIKEGPDFKIDTSNIDPEISLISGPQLVVPITNARYALNAANARWGSFYDALYGTDVLSPLLNNNKYDSERGEKVIKYAKSYLDSFAPIKNFKWTMVKKIFIEKNKLYFASTNEKQSFLSDINQIAGYNINSNNDISELILKKNNLHCRIIIDSKNSIGKFDIANIADIILESAISVIMDCEDSVSTVDAKDKVIAYKNWLGLMKGDLSCEFNKKNKTIKRNLNDDFSAINMLNNKFELKGRALMLIRNVGHLMTTPAILDKNNNEIGEGLMDALITSVISIHDIKKKIGRKNTKFGSIYIVKPKMHGPEEVAFTNDIFSYVEKILDLPLNTIKIGIMDEERRTSVNLKECIRQAKHRVAFINTGFLDRTGDEIHTSMMEGPFMQKGEMKNSAWIKAYEDRNVQIGLECGLQGKAQIGKGMWAMPDLMSDMLKQKISHPKAGANCAWVPSPTAATLHAIHYHQINVVEIQNQIKKIKINNSLKDLLTLPLLDGKNLSKDEIINELENNVQSILGYVVRWIDQGVGCSKVPDINNIGLMEDRATCRISSQALVNWYQHKIITKDDIVISMQKMAKVVDYQNKDDPKYKPMAKTYETIAYKAVYDLIFEGIDQPSGYTEPILHKRRSEIKNIQ